MLTKVAGTATFWTQDNGQLCVSMIAPVLSLLAQQFPMTPSVPCCTPGVRSRTLSRGHGTKNQKQPPTESSSGSNLDNFWFEVCQCTERVRCRVSNDSHIEAMWKRIGLAAVLSSLILQKSISLSRNEIRLPRRTVSVERSVGRMIAMAPEGNHMLEYQEYVGLRPWKVESSMDSDHRIIFMSMMTEWEGSGKWHKDDDTFSQTAQELSDYEARFRPGMFVWILHTYQEYCHPVIAGTTILKQRQHSATRARSPSAQFAS